MFWKDVNQALERLEAPPEEKAHLAAKVAERVPVVAPEPR